MKHKKQIEGYSLEDLAEEVGNLRYDALQEFLGLLSKKLHKDSEADWDRGRPQLSRALNESAANTAMASNAIGTAWRISEPYMSTK